MEKSLLLPPNVFGLPSNGLLLDLSKRLVFLGRDQVLSVPNRGRDGIELQDGGLFVIFR